MQEKNIEKQMSKKTYFIELSVIALLLVAFVGNIQILILAAFSFASLLVLLSNKENSTYYFAFFTSFAGIFVYQGRHMFFVMAALFIIKYLFSGKINRTTFLYYLLIMGYSLMFRDIKGDFSFAKLIGIILLFTIPVVANYSNQINCVEFIRHYIFGFAISTVVGFFAMNIPAMVRLFDFDLIWTEDYIELTRFFGLAFDSNFYALSNYVVIAYLLFAFERLSVFRTALILFFAITGLQTISKSYLLTLAVLIVCYFIKNAMHLKKFLAPLLVFGVAVSLFIFISEELGYNVVDLTFSRFVKGGTFADNTTGRAEIWSEYISMFKNASLKELLFGFGFNATVVEAAHNTFIEFFFHYGLIGTGIWFAYFVHCREMFKINAETFKNKTPVIILCVIAGVFFLSAYTYEAFFMELIISFVTFGLGRKAKERKYLGNVQHNCANLQG